MTNYIVAANKSWHKELFDLHTPSFPGQWTYVAEPTDLTAELVANIAPRYVFFPHWSHIVPSNIISETECVCFHMTDLPYGRGGSPLQNLIVRKHRHTKLTALRMTEEIDAGPIYFKSDLALDGSAEEILRRCARMTWDMIAELIRTNPAPVPQQGDVTAFVRRKRQDGNLSHLSQVNDVYDYIRMLDAEGYPPAFFQHEGLIYEFSEATQHGDEVRAKVIIRKRKSGE